MAVSIPELADFAIFARWFLAEGGDLEQFVDVLERPDRWESDIRAARALHDAMQEVES